MRAALFLIVLSIGLAAIVAVVSRTPASVRNAEPPPDATSPQLGATFTDHQVERAAALRGPSYLAYACALILEIAALVVLIRSSSRLGRVLPNAPWVLRALAIAGLVTVALWALSIPLDYVRGFAMNHAWGLSTQSTIGWISDQVKGLGVGVVTGGIGAIAFFGLVRAAPKTWWVWGWLTFTILTAVMSFLWPVLVAPLFNKFTPLEDQALEQRVRLLAQNAGVEIDKVLVSDASRRTTTENAYVAGIGSTKRMVLYDNLLKGDEDETAFVVAHELGHEVHNHVLKNVAIASVGLLLGFLALKLLAGNASVLSWAGIDSIGDVAVLPALLLFAIAASLVLLPAQNAVSRSFERAADGTAFALTDDPDTAVKLFRRLAFSNLSDLRPPAIAVDLLFTHPPIPQRIEAALAAAEQSP